MSDTGLSVQILNRENSTLYEEFFNQSTNALIQQSIGWADVISPLSPDTPYFLVASDKTHQNAGCLPLYHYQTQTGGILTSVPHPGPMGGIFYTDSTDTDIYHELYSILLVQAIELAKKLDCISLSIITNPFLQDADLYIHAKKPDYILNNFCQAILIPSIINSNQELNDRMVDRNVRRNLCKAKQKNIIVWWAKESDFEFWYPIHNRRLTSIGTKPLPKLLLENILSVLTPLNSARLCVARIDEQIIGGCIFIWYKNIVDAYILSSETEYLDFGVNHIITDFALKEFYNKGIEWFNWQSSQRNSGVYRFKQSWGSKELDYKFLTWTFDGFEKVFDVDFDELSRAYSSHYLAPFEALKNKLKTGIFSKPDYVIR